MQRVRKKSPGRTRAQRAHVPKTGAVRVPAAAPSLPKLQRVRGSRTSSAGRVSKVLAKNTRQPKARRDGAVPSVTDYVAAALDRVRRLSATIVHEVEGIEEERRSVHATQFLLAARHFENAVEVYSAWEASEAQSVGVKR